MIYLIALILILFGVFKYDYVQANRGRLLYIGLIYVLLICIAGFRYRLGGDTAVYTWYFEHLPTIDKLRAIDFNKSRYAPGFIFLLSLSKTISNEFYVFQFVVSILINTAVLTFFYKNSRHFFFGILLYYFFLYTELNMEALRESLAVSLFLFAWPFFKKGQWLQYYIIAICAVFFHLSASIIILLPLIRLPWISYFFRFGRRTLVICILIYVLSGFIRFYFLDVINFIAYAQGISDMAAIYSNTGLGGRNSLNIFGIIATLTRLVIYPCIAMYFLNKKDIDKNNDKDLWKIEQLSVTSIYIAIVSMNIYILYRFNNYILWFSLILISDWIFSLFKVKRKKIKLNIVWWTIIVLPMFVMQYRVYYNSPFRNHNYVSYMKYYPYNNIFDNEKNPDREKIYRKIRRHGW